MSNDMTPLRICECWARDGLQSWPDVVPTAEKLEVIQRAIDAGVREVDATSLVPPKLAPQFTDAHDLLAGLAGSEVRVRVLAPNLRGVERAVETNGRVAGAIDTVGFPISASEAHNLANVHRTHHEHLAEIERMVPTAHNGGLSVLVAVATAFGCPLSGAVEESTVFSIVERLVDLDVDGIMLSDTTGLADPVRVSAYTARAARDFPHLDLVAHFHDSRGSGMVNTYAAVMAGATCVDSCLGGIGGEPASVGQNHAGETGNISTEDIVVLLERAGIDTGIDIESLLTTGRRAEEILGAKGRSQVLRSGAALEARAARPRVPAGSLTAATAGATRHPEEGDRE
jgi:hydroxymethylglutaryl-CoA lyase